MGRDSHRNPAGPGRPSHSIDLIAQEGVWRPESHPLPHRSIVCRLRNPSAIADCEMEIISLIISVLALAVSLVVGYFYLESVIEQTRKEYQANQPDVQVLDLSSMHQGDVITLFLAIRNVSKVPAYDLTLTLDGCAEKVNLETSYPEGHKFKEHKPTLTLGPETDIRSKPISPARLRLRYRDYWGYQYEVAYSVTQFKEGSRPFYGINIDLKHLAHSWPNPGYLEIRKLLRNLPARSS